MIFAPQKPKAVGRSTTFVASGRTIPRRFSLWSRSIEASPLFSISC